MTNGNLLKVMEILKNYFAAEDYNFHCEHDVLHIAVDVTKLSLVDLMELKKLGCVDGDDGEGLKAFVSC